MQKLLLSVLAISLACTADGPDLHAELQSATAAGIEPGECAGRIDFVVAIDNSADEPGNIELIEARVVGISPMALSIPGDTFELAEGSAPFSGEVPAQSKATISGAAFFRHGITCDNASSCSWHTEVELDIDGVERILRGEPETGLFLHCDPGPE